MDGTVDDPLGTDRSSYDINKLTRWNSSQHPEYDIIIDDPLRKKDSPFKYNDVINKKIVLWSGDPTTLNAEAIVNSTNEMLNDKNPLSERILNKAGPDLKREIRHNIRGCRTGEAKLTKGYKLPSRYVVHTVGPRYNIRYKTAAESALYNSYRAVMMHVLENKMTSVAISCVHTRRRGYPAYEGAHIAIRTIRRFLEKHGEFLDTLIFVVNGEDEDVYISLLPLYFPRSECEELFSAYHLPEDIGNEMGEPVISERQIRIIGKPTYTTEPEARPGDDLEVSASISEVFETSVAVGAHSFAKMEEDLDKTRKKKVMGNTRLELQKSEQYHRYERWLRRSRQADLLDLQTRRCFYHSGFDKYGRPVVVFVGKNYNNSEIPREKALLHVVSVMDAIVNKQYVVVYLHTSTSADNHPDSEFIKDIYSIVDYRYRQNLGAFYVLHSSFWSRLMTWLFTTFNTPDLKKKVHHLPGLEYLYSRISPDQLDLPSFVTDYDIRENGSRYYNPEEDEAIGAL